MTEPSAPTDLYLKLQAALGELRNTQEKVAALIREYATYDPASIGTDTLGEPISGPDALNSVLRNLGLLDRQLDGADGAFGEALAYASRLYLKD